MIRKYCRAALVIVLCLGMLTVPVSTAFSKSRMKATSHRKSTNPNVSQVSQGLVLHSVSALVKDQKTGKLLIQKHTTAIVPIASITKLMTAMVVLDDDKELHELLVIEDEDMDTIRHSHSRLPVGTLIPRRDALLLALMASDNRSAHALARTYPGGLEACVAAMNDKAKELGLFETHFEDATGLSSGNVSSARDLVRLVDAAYQYRLIREFTTCKQAAIYSNERMIEFRNTNRLMQNPEWQIGLSKTGFIDEAGRCLVMQARVAQRPLLIVLLDSQGRRTRIGDANRIKHWLEGTSPLQRTRKG